MEAMGAHQLRLSDLFVYLQQSLPAGMSPPCMNSIASILRKDFHMRFRASNPALVRYVDPAFNCKREWVSRLLAQFLLSGMVVVSIDESHVRADGFARRKWRFAPPRLSVDDLLRPPSMKEVMGNRDDVPSYNLPSVDALDVDHEATGRVRRHRRRQRRPSSASRERR